MAFESDFQQFMRHEITIHPQTGLNNDGEYLFGSAVTYSARIVNKAELVVLPGGDEVTSQAMAWVNTTTVITAKDKITLPSGLDPVNPRILRVDRFPDETGQHHTRILL